MLEDMAARDAVNLYLSAAESGRHNVFFVGPYGRRVNFAAQQRRALNTVWALDARGDLKTGPRVAVIGAGVAGVMTAAALLSKGCPTWLFEMKDHALHLQEDTRHRMLHPTVNFWPGRSLKPTTEFPFFDWYSAIAADVMSMLRDEWNGNFLNKLSTRKFNTTVNDYKWDNIKNKVALSCTEHGVNTSYDVDIAIITTGFGSEECLSDPNQHSYWNKDQVPSLNGQTNKTYIVSGTGDGGLIEAIRLIHNDFDDGNLLIDLIERIDESSVSRRDHIRERILRLEIGVEENPSSRSADEMCDHYYNEYAAIVADIPGDIRNIIDRSIHADNAVSLFGRSKWPFALTSAPIHKLMVAHALTHRSLRGANLKYRRGELKWSIGTSGETNYTFTPPGAPAETVSADEIIIRHKSIFPRPVDFSDTEIERLERHQKSFSDFLYVGRYTDDSFEGVAGYATRRPTEDDFVDQRADLARAFMKRYPLNLEVYLGSPGAHYNAEWDTQISPSVSAPVERRLKDLFGVELTFGGEIPIATVNSRPKAQKRR